MAAEPNRPKTGMIAFITALSVILIIISIAVLEGLFSIWQGRAQEKAAASDLPSQLEMYRKEQETRLTDIAAFKQKVIAEARTGKGMAAPAPPTAPAKAQPATDKTGEAVPPAKTPPPPGKTEPAPPKTTAPAKTEAPTKTEAPNKNVPEKKVP